MKKLVKGSKAAKEFMAKIRAKRKTKKAPKKAATKKASAKKAAPKKVAPKKKLITLSGIKDDNLELLKDRLKFNVSVNEFLQDLNNQIKNKTLNKEQISAIKNHIKFAKKQILENKKMISIYKKLI